MNKFLAILSCSSVLFQISAGTEAPVKPDYAVVNRIPLTGDGGWDCCRLDEAGNRLFVSHENQVQVVDVAAHKQIATIPDTKGVHDIAIVGEFKKAFISNGKDSSVTIVDVTTLAVLKKVPVTGSDPDAIVYDPFSHCVFSFNGKSDNATVIDAKTDKVIATVVLGGAPEFAVSNGAGLLFVNLEDKDEVAVINAKTMKVEKRWPVAPASRPCAIAIDLKNNRLFIGCRSKAGLVMDATSGKILASLPIGDHVDGACFDAAKGQAFFSNGEGTITVVEADTRDDFEVVQTIATQKGAKTIALNPATHHLYLPTADYGPVPAPTADKPKPKAPVKPGTFVILDVGPTGK